MERGKNATMAQVRKAQSIYNNNRRQYFLVIIVMWAVKNHPHNSKIMAQCESQFVMEMEQNHAHKSVCDAQRGCL